MKTKSLHVLLLLCTVCFFMSCRKETDKANVNVNLLTAKSWSYDQFGIDQNFDGQIDIPETLQTCLMDDLIKFNVDGSGTFDQGANFCYPEFPQTQPFAWQLQNNDTQLEYGGTVHTILTLDESQLAIYTEESDGTGTVRHILIYRH